MELANADLEAAARSTRIVNGEIWSCDAYGNIAKFDKQLQQNCIKTKAVRFTLDIAETSNGDFVAAATRGLYFVRRYSERLR